MKIIDAHAHIFPDKIAEKAVKSISDFYEMPMKSEGYADALIKSGNEIGVESYLVFSTATKASQVESIDSFIIEQMKKYPQFIGLGTMYPGYENYEEELCRLKKNNIKGIKLHPDFQKFNFDDERLYPVFETAERMNMFILTRRRLQIRLFAPGENRKNSEKIQGLKNYRRTFRRLESVGYCVSRACSAERLLRYKQYLWIYRC